MARRIRKVGSGGPATGEKVRTPLDTLTMAIVAAHAAVDKKAEDVVVIDLRGLVDYADFFVIATSRSGKQGRTVAEEVAGRLAGSGVRPINIHGVDEGRWVLGDFGDVIVHVFRDDARSYYDLETLWEDAPRIDWEAHDPDALLESAASSESAEGEVA